MNLDTFCAELGDAAIRRVQEFDPRKPLPEDAVLVGCSPRDDPSSLAPTVLRLDNKRPPKGTASTEAYASVSRLVAELPAGLLETWPPWRDRGLPLAALLERITLLVEDASPDSVWAVVLLLARLRGLDPGEIAPAWLDAVERWETEGMVEQPYGEWPSLASALAHAHFPVGAAPSDQDFARAWTDVLRFAAGCLRQGFDPATIPPCQRWDLWRQAEAALRQEEQTYHDWLPHAVIVQLSLPLATANRRLLVDALLFAEDQPTGAAKLFYRNDLANAPLKQGFALAAHSRPDRSDGSTDITISLDPRHGLHLGDLWEELERRECAAWERAGEERPSWAPRQLAGVSSRWNQPWYIDPTRTLVASPRAVVDDRDNKRRVVPGSRLSWDEVKESIWTVYNPLTSVLVCVPGNDNPQALLNIAAAALPSSVRRLLLADWPRAPAAREGASRSLGVAPVVERVLAALIERDDSRQPVTLATLTTTSGSWQRVELSGGFAIVTAKGTFVLDDWREAPRLDFQAIQACFARASGLDRALARIETQRVKPLGEDLQEWLHGSARLTEQMTLVRQTAEVSVELAELRSTAVEIPSDADARRLWEALDRQWVLERRLGVLEQQTRTIAEAMRSVGDARVRRMTRFAARFGLPYGFATALATPTARWVAGGLGLAGEPPGWLWPVCFAVLLLGFLGLGSLLLRLDTPKGARRQHDARE